MNPQDRLIVQRETTHFFEGQTKPCYKPQSLVSFILREREKVQNIKLPRFQRELALTSLHTSLNWTLTAINYNWFGNEFITLLTEAYKIGHLTYIQNTKL